MKDEQQRISRREILRKGIRGASVLGLGGAVGALAVIGRAGGTVWQIDPYKCMQCGNCATHCVLQPSAVKCVHAYAVCGYCRICFGFFGPQPLDITEGAENQLCPTGAIKRSFVEDPYYEYIIDEPLCIGCGKCVVGCDTFVNVSWFLQVRHDRCVNCNECAIAVACPSEAFRRVPADSPYIIKGVDAAE
ncbi:MAG: ferredoxin [Planctomycetia bacterium]|nr:ferredoxin [Planctomycetia bacterium]